MIWLETTALPFIIANSNKRNVFLENHSGSWEIVDPDLHGYIENFVITKMRNTTVPAEIFKAFSKQPKTMSAIGLSIESISPNALKYATELESFNISYNLIESLPADLFVDPVELRSIDLSFNQLVFLPENIFPNLKNVSIFLHGNHLIRLASKTFYFPELKTLTLNDNRLIEFNVDFFYEKLPKQQSSEIVVYHRRRREIDNEEVPIDKIILANNPMTNNTEIRLRAKVIDVRSTNAQSCFIFPETGIFQADNNAIESVSSSNETDAENNLLTELYLSYNNISDVNFLSEFVNLKIVDLSHNRISRFDSKLLQNMHYLKRLNLAHNLLVKFDYSIPILIGPIELDLSHNQLQGELGFAPRVEWLTELNISNNGYTTIQENLKKFAPNLKKINFHDNKLCCDSLKTSLITLLLHRVAIEHTSNSTSKELSNVLGIKCLQNECSETRAQFGIKC